MDHYPLQDRFLAALKSQKVPVAIYLLNGIKLQGEIEAFDQFAVLLKSSAYQLIYKHLISTMIPMHAIRIWPEHKRETLNPLSDDP